MIKTRYLLFFVSILILLDQATKTIFFENLNYLNTFKNTGFMLGVFSDLNPFIRVTIISSTSIIIFFFYFLIQYVLVRKLTLLRAGLTISVSGILSNAIDRAALGYVRDFIPFFSGTYFNLADVFIDIGFLLISYSIFFNKEDIWYSGCLRNPLSNLKSHQFKFANKIIFSFIGYFFIAVVFNYSFMKNLNLPSDTLKLFYAGFIPFSCIYFIIIYLSTLYISNKVSGPIVALNRFVDDQLSGKNTTFELRDGDYFNELIEITEKIKQIKEKDHVK